MIGAVGCWVLDAATLAVVDVGECDLLLCTTDESVSIAGACGVASPGDGTVAPRCREDTWTVRSDAGEIVTSDEGASDSLKAVDCRDAPGETEPPTVAGGEKVRALVRPDDTEALSSPVVEGAGNA